MLQFGWGSKNNLGEIINKVKRTVSVLGALALLGTFVSASPAANADVFGPNPPEAGWFADNNLHTWCEGHVNYAPSWFDPMQDAMDYLDAQTDLTTGTPHPCDSSIDIWYDVYDSKILGSDIRGRTFCRVAVTASGVCGSFAVQLNSDLLNTYMSRRKTACHEVGHSVGLSHSSYLTSTSDCMISGDYTFTFLNTHHVDHINSRY